MGVERKRRIAVAVLVGAAAVTLVIGLGQEPSGDDVGAESRPSLAMTRDGDRPAVGEALPSAGQASETGSSRSAAEAAPAPLRLEFRVDPGEADPPSGAEGQIPPLTGSAILALRSPVSGSIRVAVENGRGLLSRDPRALPNEWAALSQCDVTAIEFEQTGEFQSSLDGQVLAVSAIARAEGPDTFRVRVGPIDGWPIEIRGLSRGVLEDESISIYCGSESRWDGPELLEPGPGAIDCDLTIVRGAATLPAPSNPNALYWIGAEGHAWCPLRWSRRAEIGHSIELEEYAQLRLSVPPSLRSARGEVRLYHTSRMWAQRPFLSRVRELLDDTLVPVPPGRFLVDVRLLEGPNRRDGPVLWPIEVDLRAGERATVELHDPAATAAVALELTVADDRRGFDWTLWSCGVGVPGSAAKPVDRQVSDDAGHPVRAITWPSLPRGLYALQIAREESVVFRHEPSEGPTERSFDLSERVRVDVFLPVRATVAGVSSASSGAPPVMTNVATVLGDLDVWPTVPYPRGGTPVVEARLVTVEGPRGATARVSYLDAHGFEGDTFVLDEQGYHELPLAPRAMITWSDDDPRPPFGWVSGVKARRVDGSELSAAPVMVTDTAGLTALGFDEPDAAMIYLPAYAENQSLGRWYDLAPAPSSTACRALTR